MGTTRCPASTQKGELLLVEEKDDDVACYQQSICTRFYSRPVGDLGGPAIGSSWEHLVVVIGGLTGCLLPILRVLLLAQTNNLNRQDMVDILTG